MMSYTTIIFAALSASLFCVSAAPHEDSSGEVIEDQIQLINGPEQTHHFAGLIGDTTHIQHHPYTAALIARSNHQGSVAILNKEWVLTTGYLISGLDPVQLFVRAGSDSAVEKGQTSYVSKVIFHPDFKILDGYDVALIKLQNPFKFNKYIKPIKIANQSPRTGSKGTISGFGYSRSNESNKNKIKTYPFDQDGRLRVATVEALSYIDCNKYFQFKYSFFSDTFFCTALKSDSGPCYNDLGSPLVIDNELAGIVARIRECTSNRYPPVYTDISKMKAWIQETIKNHTLTI